MFTPDEKFSLHMIYLGILSAERGLQAVLGRVHSRRKTSKRVRLSFRVYLVGLCPKITRRNRRRIEKFSTTLHLS